MKIEVSLQKDSYPICIEKGILNHALDYISSIFHGQKIMIISDDQVYHYYGEQLKAQLSSVYCVSSLIVEHGEQSKSFDILPHLYSQLLSFQMTRGDLIIALGGGVVGDLSGFVASTYLRGIKMIQIPTSLLAQVDSSVGGKVAVDLPEGKNLVGAFKHPEMVLIDPLTLKTLPERFLKDGMGEVIKYGCIFDKELFEKISSYDSFEKLFNDIEEVIYRCVDLKRQVVEQDLYDFGQRMLLNFGHTLGHAIEQYYGYQKYSHGEAVGIGMYQITRLSVMKGLTASGTDEMVKKILEKYQLPTSCFIPVQKLKQAMSLDKKNIQKQLSYILLKDIGNGYIYPSDLSFIDDAKEV